MGKQWRSESGQSVLSEYVMVFFVVIAVVVAMTTFLQRAFEARIHDGRDFMISSVADNSVCDANCLQATGGKIGYEYEPYYAQMTAQSGQSSNQDLTSTTGNPIVIGAIYGKSVNEDTQTGSFSNQLPPELAQ